VNQPVTPEPIASTSDAERRRRERSRRDRLAAAGLQELTPTALPPRSVLCALAALLRAALDTKYQVAVQVDAHCPDCHADAQALDDALLSLVRQARDAMPDGGCIWLSGQPARQADGRPMIALSVSAEHAGVAVDALGNGLRGRRQGDPGSAAAERLAAVEGYARQSGGSMTRRTAVGLGSTVTLYLPQSPG
jgi:signal transduction histidine kinase